MASAMEGRESSSSMKRNIGDEDGDGDMSDTNGVELNEGSKRQWQGGGEDDIMVRGFDVEEARRLVAEEASGSSLASLANYGSDDDEH